MQIGGCIMETGGIPEEIPSPAEMGVIVKREPKETSPLLSETPASTPEIESPEVDQWSLSNFSIKNEAISNENTRDTIENITIYKTEDAPVVSVIQKNECVQNESSAPQSTKKPQISNSTLKSQLKIHLESNSHQNQKKSLNIQDEIHKQQNSLINKEERNKFFDHEKLTKMFSIIAPKKDPNESYNLLSTEKSGQQQVLDGQTKSSLSLESLPHESIKCWLQRITQIQKQPHNNNNNSSATAVLEVTPELNSLPLLAKTSDSKRKIHSAPTNIVIPQQSTRIVNYRDLPYMGEMTLDNCKPRRGRKPKKADICHLIYKNYGTIIPGNPQNVTEQLQTIDNMSPTSDKKSDHSTCRTDVQNKIISSLLEKRLTLETKRNKESISKTMDVQDIEQEEPLNLCIRDLNQLKIRLLRRHDNIYESKKDTQKIPHSPPSIEIKSEPQSDDEVEFIDETKAPSNSSAAIIQKVVQTDVSDASTTPEIISTGDKTANSDGGEVGPGGYVFWPSAGVFVHPMALQSQMLYYQKLVSNNNNNSYVRSSPNSRPSSNASSNSSLQTSKKSETPTTTTTTATENQEYKTKRTSHQSSTAPPTKRKRSAIFIPPIPTENQTNPATEVSICKFKFTGGAKPSLQEKKMLSVDSGGNFRYYSGTGDKSMRGYEFFPRETLQQQAIGQNTSSSGVFLNASGEKISIPAHLADNTPGIRPHFLLSADPLIVNSDSLSSQNSSDHHSLRHKKRKTRKSLQREKLEQTFKEKGFLIQTQQLESAEGATYCKFRQLRKFTRYLFRSWKDYLPGNVRDMQMENTVNAGDIDKSDDEFDITTTSNNHGPIVDDVSVNSDMNISNRTNSL